MRGKHHARWEFAAEWLVGVLALASALLGVGWAVTQLLPVDKFSVSGGTYLVMSATDLSPRESAVYSPDDELVYVLTEFCNWGVDVTTRRFLETPTDDGGVASVLDSVVQFPAPEVPGCRQTVVVVPVPDDATSDREWRFRSESTYTVFAGLRSETVVSYSPWFEVEV